MRRRRRKRGPLPAPCGQCRQFEGLWCMDAFSGGLERCDCARGRALKAIAWRRNNWGKLANRKRKASAPEDGMREPAA